MSDLKKAVNTPNIHRWTHPSIRPCPDCGKKKPTLQRYGYIKGSWIIRCDHCLCRSVAKMSPKEAVKAWNAGNLTYISQLFIRIRTEKQRKRRFTDDR